MGRVVMKQRQPTHPRRQRHIRGILDGAVPPAHLRVIFLFAVLGVVDHQVRPLQKRDVVLVPGVVEVEPGRPPEGLVIGRVHQARAPTGDAIRDRGSGVVQILCLHLHIADPKKTLLQFGEVDAAAQVVELHGKVRCIWPDIASSRLRWNPTGA
jgi:hypothetical protein